MTAADRRYLQTSNGRAKRKAYKARPEVKRADSSYQHVKWRSGERPRRQMLLHKARSRARQLGIPCTITLDDIVIPTHCPVLNIPLSFGQGRQHSGSPSVDRVDNTLGYVPGNVAIISYRANAIKSDGNAEEHEAVVRYIRSHHGTY